MGLFKSLKGDSPSLAGIGESSHDQQNRKSEKRRLFGQQASEPSHDPPNDNPLLGRPGVVEEPPRRYDDIFTSQSKQSTSHSKMPDDNPPPYHDWTVIPDTALLPPPPALRNDQSANNASWDDAFRAHRWCDQHPLYTPSSPPTSLYRQVQSGDMSVQEPPEFKGSLKGGGKGHWKAKTKQSTTDCIILSLLPLYFARADSPSTTGRLKTIYFEVRVLALARGTNEASGIAIGFCATPYPSWRLPGWHRASLGIHGDDGRRFVNDPDGGIDFTRPFKAGDTVGIGMEFHSPSENAGLRADAHAEVFFTRNGQRDNGWQVNEERDQEYDGTFGLEGAMDLYAAVGVFGGTEFEICFAPEAWLYQPSDLT